MPETQNFGESEKSSISALVEEYKARLSQIIAFDNEIHKWSASYLVALVIGISWTLGNEKITSYSNLFLKEANEPKYHNCYLILSLAVINALYILWMTLKGYQTQQLQLYLHSVTGKQISQLIGKTFNSYEVWRRSEVFCSKKREGQLDWRRTFFYSAFTILPFGISLSILWMYGKFVLMNNLTLESERLILNLIYILVIIFHLVIAFVGISTISSNKIWLKLSKRELNDKSNLGVSPYISLVVSDDLDGVQPVERIEKSVKSEIKSEETLPKKTTKKKLQEK